jgi:hypothetical protein
MKNNSWIVVAGLLTGLTDRKRLAAVKPFSEMAGELAGAKLTYVAVWHPADHYRPHKFHPKSGRTF